MDISIIIVTWNSKACIGRCLQSLPQSCRGMQAETIVVDNASDDGTAGIVRDRFSQVKLIQLAANAGFARACNVGISHARGRIVGFLNPDTEVLARACTYLANFLDLHPRAAVAGGTLLNPDYSLQPSLHEFPTPLTALAVALKLHRLPFFRRCIKGGFEANGAPPGKPQKASYVKGAFFAARKSFLDEVGGFDERYFLWFDEVDLQRTAHERGWEVWYYPKAQALHWGAQSFMQAEGWRLQRQFLASLGLYLQKWHGAWGALPVRIITPFMHAAYRIFKR